MLTEGTLEELDGELGSFKNGIQENEKRLQKLFHNYETLLSEFRRLKSDYEEEREAREKYKRIAKDSDRNPFVLVLVDGDGYLFHEHLVRAGAEGGVNAAQLLSQRVTELLPQLGREADRCRIMVRIYANLHGLSKLLARAGQISPHGYSFAPFVANFNRSQELFDFVDAGEKKEAADYKVRELFRLFIDNSQCKHILFAGCHDAGYLSLLTPHQGKSERITLIRGPSFSKDFVNLGLPLIEVPKVFRTTTVGVDQPPCNTPSLVSDDIHELYKNRSQAEQSPMGFTKSGVEWDKEPCSLHPLGKCKNVKNCKSLHINSNKSNEGPRIADTSTNFNNDPSLHHPSKFVERELIDLPEKGEALFFNRIPVNRYGWRIDTALPRPLGSDRQTFNARVARKKFCNNYQLRRSCTKIDCAYDHAHIDPGVLIVLRHATRGIPCPARGACRDPSCFYGHSCNRKGCKGGHGCRYNATMHGTETEVARWEGEA